MQPPICMRLLSVTRSGQNFDMSLAEDDILSLPLALACLAPGAQPAYGWNGIWMIAVYLRFDPVTSGHYDIITRAAGMFETLIVVVAVNVAKAPLFTADERGAVAGKLALRKPNVKIDALENSLLVEYAMQQGAKAIVKGLRAVSDSLSTSFRWRC